MYVSRSHPDLGPGDIAAAMRAGEDALPAFETSIARRASRKFAVAFPYARSAIAALLSCMCREGDRVLIPAYTCNAVADAVVAAGMTPEFLDIDADDYNMDVVGIRGSTPPAAAIPTNMFGVRAGFQTLRQALGPQALIIEDACLSIGSSRPPHTADASVFSFALGKELFCAGGGAVGTDSRSIYDRLIRFRSEKCRDGGRREILRKLSATLAATVFYSRVLYPPAYRVYHGSGKFRRYRTTTSLQARDLPGHAWTRMTVFQAALGVGKLGRYDRYLEKMNSVADVYRSNLSGIEQIRLPHPEHSGSHFPILVTERARFLEELAADGLHIGRSMDYDYVVPSTPAYSAYAAGRTYPVAESVAKRIVNLPFHPRLEERQIDRICDRIGGACRRL